MKSDRITVATARAEGYCTRGIRQFCQENELDFRSVIRDGIPLDVARKMNDGRLNRLIERIEGQRG